MKRALPVLLGGIFVTSALATTAGAGDAASEMPPTDQQTQETQFQNLLSGATLVGRYTEDNQPDDKPPADERYTIKRVTRVPDTDDRWRFDVRIQFGKYDVTVPLILQVQWAGDTPMVTLTDYRIPALGTFSARVLFHGSRYAGTWQHGKVGGHLFGVVESKPAVNEEAVPDATRAPHVGSTP